MQLHDRKIFLWLALALMGTAATAQQPTARQPLARTVVSPNQPDPERWQPLSKVVPLPDVPEFTGKKKLIQASTQANSGSQPSYVYVYVTAEDRKLVKDWYEKSLSSYSWKIGRNTANNIEAKNKDGNELTMLFVHNPDETMPTRFSIRYCPQPHQ